MGSTTFVAQSRPPKSKMDLLFFSFKSSLIFTSSSIHKFFQDAGNSEQFSSDASVAKALEHLDLPDLSTPFPGMKITLMPHQVIGVAWMLDKEKSRNKGGILADEMGLGKV